MVGLIINFKHSTQLPYIFMQETSSCRNSAWNAFLSVYYPVLDWESAGRNH